MYNVSYFSLMFSMINVLYSLYSTMAWTYNEINK